MNLARVTASEVRCWLELELEVVRVELATPEVHQW